MEGPDFSVGKKKKTKLYECKVIKNLVQEVWLKQ
jgi:hypothetical protein